MTARSPEARLIACSNALQNLPQVHAVTVDPDRPDHDGPYMEAIVDSHSKGTVVPPSILTTIAQYGCGLTDVTPRPTQYIHCDIVALENTTPATAPTTADTDFGAAATSAASSSAGTQTDPSTPTPPKLPQPELIVAPPTTAHSTAGTTDGACTIARDSTLPPTVMISLASEETTVTADCTPAHARHIAQALTDAADHLITAASQNGGEDTAASTTTSTAADADGRTGTPTAREEDHDA